tara:strand:+ start:103 stop:294 length:192 start_codon:yes stop_codon:yes gene_type:complete
MEAFKIATGIETKIVKGFVSVRSEKLEENPLLNYKISSVKFRSKHLPKNRISINDWFRKFEAQ